MNKRVKLFTIGILLFFIPMAIGLAQMNTPQPTDEETPLVSTPTIAATSYKYYPEYRMCDAVEVGEGPSWLDITIGESTLDDLLKTLDRLGDYEIEVLSSSEMYFRLIANEDNDELYDVDAYLAPSFVPVCFSEDGIITSLGILHIDLTDVDLADLVSVHGVPDAVTWMVRPMSRIAFWFDEGIAATIDAIEDAKIPYRVTAIYYYPFVDEAVYENAYPYAYTREIIFTADEQNPFDFDSIVATVTAQPTRTPTPPYVPPNPTITPPTEYISPSPTVTPPTDIEILLQPSSDLEGIQQALVTENECELPCFLGLQPGITASDDVLELTPLDFEPDNLNSYRSQFVHVSDDEIETPLFLMGLTVVDEILSQLTITILDADEWLPKNSIDLPSLLALQIDERPEIFIHISPTRFQTSIYIYYSEPEMLFQYRLQLNAVDDDFPGTSDNPLLLCPSIDNHGFMQFRLRSPELAYDDTLYNLHLAQLIEERDIVDVERLTGLDAQTFQNQIVEDPDECIELP